MVPTAQVAGLAASAMAKRAVLVHRPVLAAGAAQHRQSQMAALAVMARLVLILTTPQSGLAAAAVLAARIPPFSTGASGVMVAHAAAAAVVVPLVQ